MRNRIAIAILVLALIATSCVSRKTTVAPEPAQSFEWMTANLSIQAEGHGKQYDNLSGQLRIRRDSIVWLSVTAMGVEALRVKMSADSVWLINRMDKVYLAEPLDAISAQINQPVSMLWVQSLLFDNNEGFPPVENQTVMLQGPMLRGYSAKLRYSNIRLDKETTFPLRITDKMDRISIKRN